MLTLPLDPARKRSKISLRSNSSYHNPDLTTRLAGQDWIRLFPAGAPNALALLLDGLA